MNHYSGAVGGAHPRGVGFSPARGHLGAMEVSRLAAALRGGGRDLKFSRSLLRGWRRDQVEYCAKATVPAHAR